MTANFVRLVFKKSARCIIILFVLSEGSNTARQEAKTRRAIRDWELERKGVIKG